LFFDVIDLLFGGFLGLFCLFGDNCGDGFGVLSSAGGGGICQSLLT